MRARQCPEGFPLQGTHYAQQPSRDSLPHAKACEADASYKNYLEAQGQSWDSFRDHRTYEL